MGLPSRWECSGRSRRPSLLSGASWIRVLFGIAPDQVEAPAAQDGDVGRAVILAVAHSILTERDIELPVQVRAEPEVAILLGRKPHDQVSAAQVYEAAVLLSGAASPIFRLSV